MSNDQIDQLEALAVDSGCVLDLSDESGAPLCRITVSGSTTVGEIAGQAAAFGLPGDDYAVYGVGTRPDGSESVRRIPNSTRLEDIGLDDEQLVRLRFAPSLKGA